MPEITQQRWARRRSQAELRHEAVSALVAGLLPTPSPVLSDSSVLSGSSGFAASSGSSGPSGSLAPSGSAATFRPATVVDLGGGAGTLSVELAVAGHEVVVVDPSPDSLAALGRRAREAGVADRVRGVQGDAASLSEACSRPADLVLCHDVLELVDDPAATLAHLAACLHPTGALSLLTAQRSGVVVARAAAGRLSEALAVLSDPAGRAGAEDPCLRRYDADAVAALLAAAGLEVVAVTGCPVLSELVPETVGERSAEASAVRHRLEVEAAAHPDLRGLAPSLHWHVRRR